LTDFKPKITVITILYNAESVLEGCIQSVLNQTYDNIEYVIVDGASTDDSVKIIERYADKIDKYISEPDNGISDAMNKAIGMASGDYLLFLHADDYFETKTSLEDNISTIKTAPIIIMADILFGKDFVRQVSRGLDWRTYFKTGVYHQGALCSKALFDNIGGFKTDLKVAMDYDFFLRAFLHSSSFEYTGKVLSVMRDTGISSQIDWPSLSKRFAEEKRVHKANCQTLIMKIVYTVYWPTYLLYRRIKFFF
jgi:glycosyltransferase involved in cell wall biosynthesis